MTDSGPWRRRRGDEGGTRRISIQTAKVAAARAPCGARRLLIEHVAIGDQLNFVFVFSKLIRRKSFFAVFKGKLMFYCKVVVYKSC